jgi:hypothetical protein
MRELLLDSDGEADRAGFASLAVAVGAVKDLPAEAWRVIGGWMVRAWTQGGVYGGAGRPTVDVDLGLLPQRSAHLAGRVPFRLAEAGLKPSAEPFRFEGPGGVLLDLVVPPGTSRFEPPRLGEQIVFEAPGSRFAFELPAEMVRVQLEGGKRLEFQTARLGAALVLKLIVLAGHRSRFLDDARDVATLLAVVRREPEAALEDLRSHARRRDVALAVISLMRMFGNERDRGCVWIEQESGVMAALTAVDDANWLHRQLKHRRHS